METFLLMRKRTSQKRDVGGNKSLNDVTLTGLLL